MSTIAAVIGRILLAAIFLVSGAGKILDPAGTEAMMTGAGLPAGFAIPTGIFEILAGLCLAIGLMTRLTAVLLFGFVALATLLFHNRINEPLQMAMALKNLAIMGGLLLVFAHSQMWWSYDAMRRTRKGELATRSADDRARDAELRAARAEGAAAALAPETVEPPKRRWF
ncbi:MAG TPA: DoxX family protein [Novosphingobium sp.]|nr:DoxX family protein [Novosphingobium sp.]